MDYIEQTKSKQRVIDHGEVFTAEREVNAMLDLVKQETERIDSRFLEPACGTGNFLAEILRRKLDVAEKRYGKSSSDFEMYAILAVSSVYGVELLPDNVTECRNRLFRIFDAIYTKLCKSECNDDARNSARFILERNILCGDALSLRDADGKAIVFSEWSLMPDGLMKRRDFELAQMLKEQDENLQLDFLGVSGDYHTNLSGEDVLKPVREFPLVHYRKVAQDGG